MNREKMQKILDERILILIENYYDPHYCNHRHDCIERIREVLYIAEDLGMICYDDYDRCLGIITYMGTDADMEDRLW